MNKKIIIAMLFLFPFIPHQANAGQEVFGLSFFSSYDKIENRLKKDPGAVFVRVKNPEINNLRAIRVSKNPAFSDLGVEIFTDKFSRVMGVASNNKYVELKVEIVGAYLQFNDEGKFYKITVVWDDAGGNASDGRILKKDDVLHQLELHLKNSYGVPRRIKHGQEYRTHSYTATLRQDDSKLIYKKDGPVRLKGRFTTLVVTNTYLEDLLPKQKEKNTSTEERSMQELLRDFDEAFSTRQK